MKIDEKAIRKLAGLLDETNLTEIEVAEGEQAIRVSRGGTTVIGGGASVSTPQYSVESDPTVPQAANLDTPATITQDHPGAVTSPMVGTVYMQPEPDTPSFVRKGDSVSEGDTLVIIEAMKVMNPIKAHRSGTVTQVLTENAQPVEFGDILMVIE